jgi:hypothetical protein
MFMPAVKKLKEITVRKAAVFLGSLFTNSHEFLMREDENILIYRTRHFKSRSRPSLDKNKRRDQAIRRLG